jgi:hypothetical protein
MISRIFLSAGLGIAIALSGALAPDVQAGIASGLDELKGQVDIPTGDLNVRDSVEKTLNVIVGFVALAGVVAIITAGMFLLLGMGSESSAQRAKKIIIYAIVGILVIFFARVIVGFFTGEIAGGFDS